MIKAFFSGIPVIGPVIALVPDFVWQGLAIFGFISAIYFAGDYRGVHRERTKWEVAAKKAKEDAAKQDKKAADITTADETAVTAGLLTQAQADKRAQDAVDKAIADYKAQHPQAPVGPHRSVLTDDDVKRLRD